MTTTTITAQKPKRTLVSFFPIVHWLPRYQSAWLRPDLIAALTVTLAILTGILLIIGDLLRMGVLALGILQGLILAVFIGLLALLIGTKTRATSVLGKVPGEKV